MADLVSPVKKETPEELVEWLKSVYEPFGSGVIALSQGQLGIILEWLGKQSEREKEIERLQDIERQAAMLFVRNPDIAAIFRDHNEALAKRLNLAPLPEQSEKIKNG